MLVFDDTETRLVRTLLKFGKSAAATPQDGGLILLNMSHQALAQAVGAARETVSLNLTQLRQRNLVKTGRNRLWFDPSTLEQFARGRDTANAGT